MHRLRSMIELTLVEDDHAIIQIDAGLDRLLDLGVAGPGINPMQLGRPRIHIAAICRAHRTLAVVDQGYVFDRFVCVFHIVECR